MVTMRARSCPLRAPVPLFIACLMILAASAVAAAAPASQSGDGARIEGLDTLATRTLLRAFDGLGIAPVELGFDKLYAEDDTFRLAIVEELLNDPLRLPSWQARTVEGIRRIVDGCRDSPHRIGALIQDLGEIGEASIRPARSAPGSDNASGAVRMRPPASRRHHGRWAGEWGRRSDDNRAAPPVSRFIDGCLAAERDLDRAFARLTDRDRTTILLLAPAFWGDWEDPDSPDRLRKGALHREVGSPIDTTGRVTADPILDAATRLDRSALTLAAWEFVKAFAVLGEGIAAGRFGEGTAAGGSPSTAGRGLLDRVSGSGRKMEGITGRVRGVHDTPWGLLVIGGDGPNVYSAEALSRIAFLIEPGGDDVYRGRIASALGGLTRSFSGIYDHEGNDLYDAHDRPFALGGAVLGVAALIDRSGDDVYRGDDGAQGAGFFGVGLLYDGAGVDFVEGRNFCQGAGAFGLGALISNGAATPPPAPSPEEDRAFALGIVKVPGTGALPVRYDDNDIYQAARQSQGFASTFGVGLLHDETGNDLYRAGGRYLHRPLRPNDFQSLSQGFSIGFRPRAAGGIGILIDEEGNDFYNAEIYAQGVSYWYSIGLLHDRCGNDRYHATHYAQGAGVHLAVGSLWDGGGDDQYVSQFGVTQGTAHDLSVGFLLDESGDDYYVVDGGQGMSITNSSAIFIDAMGNDLYATTGGGQGTLTWARGFCGAGIFLDLEGKDTYPAHSGGKDGAVWSHDLYALGIDLDRDLQLPGETTPDIVLTAQDTVRSVKDLFAEASIWEVGSAREKVRRARKALSTKGREAIEYVLREKMASDDGLEYRAILEVGQTDPELFTRRILARLDDPNGQVQRNVIALLGEMTRKEGRLPLEGLLSRAEQEKNWTRVVQALGRIGEPVSAPAIRPFLGDPSERRRIAACVALASIKDTLSVSAMAALLDDPLLTVRSAASSALQSLGAAAVAPTAETLGGAGGGRPAGESDPAREHQIRVKVETIGKIMVALEGKADERSLRARRLAVETLLAEMDRLPPHAPATAASAGAARAAAIGALMKAGDEKTKEAVAARMKGETDPLVLRTYEMALSRE
ncbi:MAG: hypothetical protein FJY88_01635 [Candidatus Eisenbacteria bacterium]|nr:hypothetical protein [Candidatus Eisenbacteria bacterium]